MADLQPDDVNEILRRAADLQARTRGTQGLTGLTQADLESLGQEIGIDPAFVAEALRQRARNADSARAPRGGVFGGPARVTSERTLPAPLTDDLWASIAAAAARLSGDPGRTTMTGSGREWRGGKAFLTATPVRDGTRLHVERRTADTGVLTIALPMMVAFLVAMLAAMGWALTGLGVGALLLVVTFLATRFAYGRHVRGVWNETEQMLDRLDVDALREIAPATTGTPSGARLHLPEDDAPDPLSSDLDRTRTRT